MKRFTVKRKDGKWAIGMKDGKTVEDQLKKWPLAVDRLAAYENTGLEPWEIEQMQDAFGRGMTLRTESILRLGIIREISTGRLREMVRSELES